MVDREEGGFVDLTAGQFSVSVPLIFASPIRFFVDAAFEAPMELEYDFGIAIRCLAIDEILYGDESLE
jgi:hypothetical protein